MSEERASSGIVFRQIQSEWWELLLSGGVFAVEIQSLPVQDFYRFREACLRQARKRDKKASVRASRDLSYAYVQAADAGVFLPDVRADVATAVSMPPPPLVRKVPDKPAAPAPMDGRPAIEALLASAPADLPRINAEVARQHQALEASLRDCDCGTPNFRTHPSSCPAFPLMPLVELTVRKMPEPPEAWAVSVGLAPRPGRDPLEQTPTVIKSTVIKPPADDPFAYGGSGTFTYAAGFSADGEYGNGGLYSPADS